MKKKHILILGGSVDQLFMLKTAKDMGLGTIVIDGKSNAPGLKLSDLSESIDFSNLDEVYNYLDRLLLDGVEVCGVSTMGSDVPHILAAISNKYGWQGPSIETGKLTTNKYLMKQKLSQNGIPVPRFSLVQKFEEVNAIWKKWNCSRIVIKPTDRAGSRGVRILDTLGNIEREYDHAFSNSIIKEVMIEEYIDGPQISTESIIYDDYSSTPGFADRVYKDMDSFHPQIMENGGWVPTAHSKKIVDDTNNLVETAARVLEIKRGVAKGDVVIHPQKGLMIIEIAARLSGGDFCESLVPLSSGINYVSDVIRMAIGEKPDYDSLSEKSLNAVANRYFFLPPGQLQEIIGVESMIKLPEVEKIDLYYKPEDTILKIQSHNQRTGVFIVVAKNRTTAQEMVDHVYENIKFRIDNKWFTGHPSNYRA